MAKSGKFIGVDIKFGVSRYIIVRDCRVLMAFNPVSLHGSAEFSIQFSDLLKDDSCNCRVVSWVCSPYA